MKKDDGSEFTLAIKRQINNLIGQIVNEQQRKRYYKVKKVEILSHESKEEYREFLKALINEQESKIEKLKADLRKCYILQHQEEKRIAKEHNVEKREANESPK
jgi:predicted nucleotide-binding protein (sugar kinase/HSP70/actin superfamily)